MKSLTKEEFQEVTGHVMMLVNATYDSSIKAVDRVYQDAEELADIMDQTVESQNKADYVAGIKLGAMVIKEILEIQQQRYNEIAQTKADDIANEM